MYDIVRKISSGKINLTLNDKNKLHLESDKSTFNLNCISHSEFPVTMKILIKMNFQLNLIIFKIIK